MKFRKYGLMMLLATVSVGLACYAVEAVRLDGHSATANIEPAPEAKLSEPQGLAAVLDAVAEGNFEIARGYMDKPGGDPLENEYIAKLKPLLDSYDKFTSNLQESRRSAYQEYVKEMRKNVELAHWRQGILQVSQSHSNISDEEKVKLEKDLGDKLQKNWLTALAQCVSAHQFAERMDMSDTVEQAASDEIIEQCLRIAKELEQKDNGMDAYTKVYGLLEVLDQKKYKYDELYDKLLREATLTALYVPDPNADGVSWQSRRKDVSSDMIDEAVEIVDRDYVKTPDYQAMTLKGLNYCLILSQVEKLKGTFEKLKDDTIVSKYRQELNSFTEEAKAIDPNNFDDKKMLSFLKKVTRVNAQTLELPKEVVLAEFIEGAFSELDTYSYVIWPAEVERFRKDMTNEFSGIGILLGKNEEGYLKAESLVMLNAPAYMAGIDANDIILKVDGQDTKKMTIEKAVELITGPSGTNVVLTINREGFEEPRDFTVTRGHIAVPTVNGLCRKRDGNWQYWVDPNDNIAYLNLTSFSGDSPGSMARILSLLKLQGMQGLVLDLRNNSGGYLSGAIAIANDFLKPKSLIVSARGRDKRLEELAAATADGIFDTELPMVVLVNSISASASEIVSGALKDHRRAVVIGTRTYGKGSVQRIWQLAFGDAQMKMTTAYYYLPLGRRVHRDPKDKANEDYGVIPDIKVELTPKQIETYFKQRRKADILHRDDLPAERRTWKVYDVQEMVASDPQLDMGLMVLRGKILKQQVLASQQRTAESVVHSSN